MSVIYKTSKTYYYGIELTPNASRKTFLVKVPAHSFSKFQNCKTVKLSDEQFEQFSNFSGDQWIDMMFGSESRNKFFVFTDKVKRAKKSKIEKISDYYNAYLSK